VITAEDYELWSRMQTYGSCTNLQSPQLLYRSHAQSISHRKRGKQADESARICCNNLRRTFPDFFLDQRAPLAELIADLVYRETALDTETESKAVATLLALEGEYLLSLGPIDNRIRRCIKRLTARWLVQAILRKKDLSNARRLQFLYQLRNRADSLIEEAYLSASRRIKARHWI